MEIARGAIELDGRRVSYLTAGDAAAGPTLLLIHGSGVNARYCWWHNGRVFFVSASGGDAKNGDVNGDGFAEGYGQIWEYRPAGRSGGGHLRLIFESPGPAVLDSPDNLAVTPRGD